MTTKTKPRLLASSPTLEGIGNSIARFYGGEQKQLREAGADRWQILRGNGEPIEGVRITKHRGRYRFEAHDQEPEAATHRKQITDQTEARELADRCRAVDARQPWPQGFDHYRQRVQHYLQQDGPVDLPWPSAEQIEAAMNAGTLPGTYAFSIIDEHNEAEEKKNAGKHAQHLRRLIEHAPRDPGQMADDLRGWTMEDTAEYICARCAGRIIARGCRLPDTAAPVWPDSPTPAAACVCCGSEPRTGYAPQSTLDAAEAFSLQQMRKREGAHRAPKIKERQRLLLSGLDCDPRQADLFDA